MTVYVLFQTDVWQTKASRVFFGVFSSKEQAVGAAKENNLYHPNVEVIILECKLDEYEEQ